MGSGRSLLREGSGSCSGRQRLGDGFGAGDELVLDGLVGFHATIGIPAETSGDEIQKCFVLALQGLLDRLGARAAAFAFRGDGEAGFA